MRIKGLHEGIDLIQNRELIDKINERIAKYGVWIEYNPVMPIIKYKKPAKYARIAYHGKIFTVSTTTGFFDIHEAMIQKSEIEQCIEILQEIQKIEPKLVG